MKNWTRFGDAVGSHMALIAPLCVAAGVFFPQVFGVTERVVPILFAIMTFQGSLNNNLTSVLRVFRHPADMLSILAVTTVVMPTIARAFAGLVFADNPNLIIGATLEYCVPVAVVCFMWTGMYGGNLALALATILVSTVLSPFTIPVSLQLLLGETVQVDAVSMMTQMLFMIALPALAGMVVNEVTDDWGHTVLSPAISPGVKIVLMLILASNSTQISDYMHHVTPQLFEIMGFILAFSSLGFLLGILLAYVRKVPMPTLVTMCFGVGMRNISAGAVIAVQFFPDEVVVPVMMGTLFQQVLAGVFGSVMARVVARRTIPGDEKNT